MALAQVITGEDLLHETLTNGLNVYVMKKPGFQKKYAVYATHYGSLDSKFEIAGEGLVAMPDGIAHFLEHKLFEEENGHVFDRFSEFGASVNAYTSYTMTSYLFSTIDYFPEALRELLRFVQTPYLTKENVQKEKGIIEQELRMYEDHPDRRIYRNLLNALYQKHPIRIDIGGTVESIAKIDVNLLMKCYHTFYQPSNMAVFVVGDVDLDQVIGNISSQMETGQAGNEQPINRIYPTEPKGIAKPWIEQTLNISQPRYYLGFKDEPLGEGNLLLKQQLAMSMIWRTLSAKSSPVYEDLYAKGLIDDSFGASFSGMPQYAFSVVGGETNDPDQLDSVLRKAIGDLKRRKLSSQDVERMKRRALGNYLGSFNSLEYIANSFLFHQFSGTSLLEFPLVLETITVDDVNDMLDRGLNLDESAVSLLVPE